MLGENYKNQNEGIDNSANQNYLIGTRVS